ncbi:MAG: diacylglycerol kinase family protein [Anaerolineales bacterium]|nr:diacylglycerol kinase family protein [Anaerolineales bacterium]
MTSPKRAQSRIASFNHAFAGWLHVLQTQRNAWIHAMATILVFAIAIWVGLDRLSGAILLVTIGLVWISEFLNTALEAIVDLASPEVHPLARVGKDVGAAAVLISALIAIIVGLLVLGPPFLNKIASLL